jgi:hypothetical protein
MGSNGVTSVVKLGNHSTEVHTKIKFKKKDCSSCSVLLEGSCTIDPTKFCDFSMTKIQNSMTILLISLLCPTFNVANMGKFRSKKWK